MREDWLNRRNEENRGKVWHLAMDIKEHANLLLDVPLPIHQQEHLLHIRHAAQTLLAIASDGPTTDAPCHPLTHPPHPSTQSVPTSKTPLCREEKNEYNKKEDQQGNINGMDHRAWANTHVPPSRSLHILLVEDNPFTQKLMTRLLTLRNHTVTVANHGEEALAWLTTAHAQKTDITEATPKKKQAVVCDLILMDVRMPIMDGLQTTIAIRQWEKQIEHQRLQGEPLQNGPLKKSPLPIIAVTALTSDADRSLALQAGMDAFHSKPIQANQLFSEIDRLLPMASPPPPTSKTQERPLDRLAGRHPDTQEETIKTELDIHALLKTVENDRTLLKEVIELYHTDAPKQIQSIHNGIVEGDASKVQDAAHALKGASGAFGRTPAYDLAFKLEQIGLSRNLSQAAPILEQLKNAVASLEDALYEELTQNGVSE